MTSNYRPISIHYVFNKVLEKLIHLKLPEFHKNNNTALAVLHLVADLLKSSHIKS